MPRLCKFYPGICLTTEEKARKNLSQGKKNLSQVEKNLSQSTVYILPKTPTHYKALTNTHITKPTHTPTRAYTHTTKQYKTTTVLQFYYTVASCWLFLYDLYYDARIHDEHQALNNYTFSKTVFEIFTSSLSRYKR